MAYHTQHAVKGTYPHLGIDYGKVVLTTGWLAGVYSVEMSSNNEECIDFSWLNESTSSLQSPMGQVILVAYSPLNKKHEYLWAASNRASGCAMLEVPTSFSGDSVHCWIIFVSENGKKFSTSRYLATVTVA